MNIQKISALILVVTGIFLIVTSVMWSNSYPTSEIVKNAVMGLGFLVGGVLVLSNKSKKLIK